MAKSAIISFLTVLLLGLSSFSPAEAIENRKNITVTVEESELVHPGMTPRKVHRVLGTHPIYADSVTRKRKRYFVEVYNTASWKEFGVVYRVRKGDRIVVMTAWKNLI